MRPPADPVEEINHAGGPPPAVVDDPVSACTVGGAALAGASGGKLFCLFLLHN